MADDIAQQSCPECGALPHRPHEPECPTLVPVVVHEDGSPATLDDLVTDDGPDLADEIARAGRIEVTRAEEQAARWEQWAQQVHQLIEDIPTVGPDPRYLADDGIESFDVPFHVGVEDAVRMERFLARVLRDADAVTCAWRRAAVDVQARAHAALRACDADPQHFVTLGGEGGHRAPVGGAPAGQPAHACPGGCGTDVPHHKLTCRGCWWLLPKGHRHAVTHATPADRLRVVGEAVRWLRENVENGKRKTSTPGRVTIADRFGGAPR